MERKDLTPENEMLFNLYNDSHDYKLKLENVEEIFIEGNILHIISADYGDDGTFFGYFGFSMDMPSNSEEQK